VRRVAILIESDELGGAERSALTLTAGLDRARWQPTVIHHPAPALAPLVAEAVRAGAAEAVVPGMPEGVGGALRAVSFARFLRRERFDVLHAQLTWPLAGKFALAAAVAARVPAVLATVHSYPDFRMTRPTEVQQRLLSRRIGRYITPSADTSERLARRLHLPAEQVTTIPNGIVLPAAGRRVNARLRAELAGPDRFAVVVTVARLDAAKGLDVLIDAAARVPRARFVLVGEGPERDALESRVASLGIGERVSMLGWRNDVDELLGAADVFVLASRHEAQGIALLEAMAHGIAVVATRVGGVPELVEDGESGLVVASDSSLELAAAIERLIADERLRRRLAAAGRTRVAARFGAQRMVEAVSAVYDELLEAGG